MTALCPNERHPSRTSTNVEATVRSSCAGRHAGSGRCLRRWLENGVDGAVLEHDDLHVSPAAETAQRIDFEDALQELGSAAPACLELH